MVVLGQLLLVHWFHMFDVVVLVILIQHNARFDPAIRNEGDNGAVAGPARGQVEERGLDGESPGGVRAWDCDWWARALGRAPVCRRVV